MNSSRYRKAMPTALLLVLSVLAGGCAGSAGSASTASTPRATTAQVFAELEREYHADLGVYVLDSGTGRTVTFNPGERFAYCSTFKALATGILLQRDTSAQLNQVIRYSSADLRGNSPVTAQHAGTGMTLRALMAAAVDYSDNTAGDLLLNQLGGPHMLTEALRGLGDMTTDADRTEPALNAATPGDIRDTSTAQAFGTDLRDLILPNVLPGDRRQLLTGWLLANTTGGPYIRAGVPRGWRVGDKTGNGGWGTRNDIAVAWPPGAAPVIIAVFSHRESANAASDDALIADATRAALAAL